MMKMQQSIEDRTRHCTGANKDITQQVNCKGDKIENISQLLMHLGMDDIKDKCDDCDAETRLVCLEKEAQTDELNRNTGLVSAPHEDSLQSKSVDSSILNESVLADADSVEHTLLQNKWPTDRKRTVENKFILSSIFASLFVVVMTLH